MSWALIIVVCAMAFAPLERRLTAMDFGIAGSESEHVDAVLAQHFPQLGAEQDVIVYDGAGVSVDSPEFRQVVDQAVAAARSVEGAREVTSPYDVGGEQMVSPNDRGVAVGLVGIDGDMADRAMVARTLQHELSRFETAQIKVAVTGYSFGQYSQAAAQPGIGTAQINVLSIPVPPLSEQHAIADYLDRETARIDTLIEEQQRLIEMLRERRLAVITETVEGASTTNRVASKSGWYPSLPVGWGRARVKSVATRVTDGAHISPDTDGGEFDFVSTRDLDGGSIDFEGALKTTRDTYEYMVKTGCQPYDGDVLFSKDGTVGETAVVRGTHQFVVASSLVIISPDRERIVSKYLAYVFASKTAREQAASMMRGAGLPRLSVGNLARLELPIPPLGEQLDVVAYLDQQTSKVDTLIAESEHFIELARERRAALITAAVTGQFDVREMV
ncbi:restriction endonuclease subunit S [Williamsia muralis]|uniref:restriction endonuclease subunit S n=1 Tax=Williamsia marianensis TaxID=85044 RepID=UPI000786D900|nr:restriction endonuclease subunit S [Williamsia muralis]